MAFDRGGGRGGRGAPRGGPPRGGRGGGMRGGGPPGGRGGEFMRLLILSGFPGPCSRNFIRFTLNSSFLLLITL